MPLGPTLEPASVQSWNFREIKGLNSKENEQWK